MAGRDTNTVIQGLESEIERLSAKLRKAYDTHAATVEKFERDMELLKRELNSAYQLSARLTNERAVLASVSSDSPDYAAQVDEQLRVLTTELRQVNEERRNAEDKINELQARLEASEGVATSYIASLNQLEQEYGRARAELNNLSSGPGITDSGPTPIPGAARAVNGAADEQESATSLQVSVNELTEKIDAAERKEQEYRSRITELEKQYAAADQRAKELVKELERERQTVAAAKGATQGSATDDVAELRSRIDAAEYILGDYQAKLKQAEIDRDEAVRELQQVTVRLESLKKSGSSGSSTPSSGLQESRIRELEQKLSLATLEQAEQEKEFKRIKSRLKSAETLAGDYMSRFKEAESDHKKLINEIASLQALLEASNRMQGSMVETSDASFEEKLNDARSAEARAVEETRRVKQQLEIATQLYEALKAEQSDRDVFGVTPLVVEAEDSPQLSGLRSENTRLSSKCDEYEQQLLAAGANVERLQQAVVTAEEKAAGSQQSLETIAGEYRALQEEMSGIANALRAEQGNAQRLLEERQASEQERKTLLEQIETNQRQIAEISDQRREAELRTTQAEQRKSEIERELQLVKSLAAQREDDRDRATRDARLEAELEQARVELNEKIHSHDEALDGVRDMQARLAADERHIAELEKQRDDLHRRIETLAARAKMLEEAHEALANDKQSLERSRIELENNQKRTQEKIGGLVKEISARNRQLDHQAAAHAAVQEENARIAQDAADAKVRIAALEQDNEAKRIVIDRLDRDAETAKTNSISLDADLGLTQQKLVSVQQQLTASERKEALIKQDNERLGREVKSLRNAHEQALARLTAEKENLEKRLIESGGSIARLTRQKEALEQRIIDLAGALAPRRSVSESGPPRDSTQRAALRLVRRSGGSGVTGRMNLKVAGSDISEGIQPAAINEENEPFPERATAELVKAIPVQGVEDLVAAIASVLDKSAAGLLGEFKRLRRVIWKFLD